ncbi:uncharacterized protein LY89DRAFT_737402 [Mollisia scopiformis]|uniref:Uncharacterized protein n=1 Tax=Mollisia scopiformis TaxID=149040 RepID=A0A194WZQ1_MOLSC|nr:uncharacterized protein LY89DRAFT_737402 [Mollisia scopiformis]KUJ13420.1 hypothetical protein LY89DRAFT_737402 [Mollisia scopiformis]
MHTSLLSLLLATTALAFHCTKPTYSPACCDSVYTSGVKDGKFEGKDCYQAFPTSFDVPVNERNYTCEIADTIPGCCKGDKKEERRSHCVGVVV